MQSRKHWVIRQCVIFISMIALFVIVGSCSRHQQEPPPDFEPGGPWLQGLRQDVDSTIQETVKKEQLMSIIDQFEEELNSLDEVVQSHYQHMIAVDKNIHASPDDFRQVFNELHKQQMQHRTRFLDLRFQLVALVTADEWDKLTSISKKDTLFLNWQRKPMQN